MLFIIQNTLYIQYIHTLFLRSINRSHLINGTYLTEKQNSPLPPPYFNLLLSPSSLRLSVVLCSPSSTFPCKMNGTDVVGQDSSTPWSPSPHYSLSMRSETCFLIIAPPQRLPPLRANRHTGRGEMGRPRATRSEGRGQRSAKPCLGNMKKTYC